ncbi:MAG: hypothetical protein CL859_06355 [Cyanobium sp. ARS6]|nr:hypothetical protein [Cyanobium sp. ARS6]
MNLSSIAKKAQPMAIAIYTSHSIVFKSPFFMKSAIGTARLVTEQSDSCAIDKSVIVDFHRKKLRSAVLLPERLYKQAGQ